jgi:predicted RNase H-like HicB family nuclease
MLLEAVIERDFETGLLVGSVADVQGLHAQGASIDEVAANLREVLELLLAEGALHNDVVTVAFKACS